MNGSKWRSRYFKWLKDHVLHCLTTVSKVPLIQCVHYGEHIEYCWESFGNTANWFLSI